LLNPSFLSLLSFLSFFLTSFGTELGSDDLSSGADGFFLSSVAAFTCAGLAPGLEASVVYGSSFDSLLDVATISIFLPSNPSITQELYRPINATVANAPNIGLQ
jgi:hypothetical protein